MSEDVEERIANRVASPSIRKSGLEKRMLGQVSTIWPEDRGVM